MLYTTFVCDHCHDERDDKGFNNTVKNYGGHKAVSIITTVPYIIPAVEGGTNREELGHLCNICRQILKDWQEKFFGKAKKNEHP